MRPSRLGAVAVLLLAGCSTSVAGTSSPAASVAAPPAATSLDPSADGLLRVADVVATPDGGVTALLIAEAGSSGRSAFVQLVPGDGGPTVGAVTEAPAFAHPSELVAGADGTVVALASVPPESGDVALDGSDGPDLALAVLAPGSPQVELRPVGAVDGMGGPESGSGVLSADGATLYASLRWTVDGRTATRLAAVDVATGEVTATAPLGVESPGTVGAHEVALRPDGGVAVLVTADRDAAGSLNRTLVAEFDAGLRPVGAPVEVVDEEDSSGFALAVLPDGTVVVSVETPGEHPGTSRLVSVRDGAVRSAADLPGPALDLAVTPSGDRVYASYSGDFDRGEGGAHLAAVDVAMGKVVDDVPLCPNGYAAPLALATDGQTVVVTAGCTEDGVWSDLAFLIE
ncbi:hypothetical protein [Geodermatophilus nigrescens]|uniref:Lactonase, 7-bladed beta-propeller n=1 Tax=Geodermatophilus nigrescens TaxID=1070870 RepID=A0A1M5JNH3_9ACTN|nr:hypothetical protein [Geodermatophilus nigrescens]SHG42081.1 hypothetical protein SAMN05444351_2581 [Geodermatophilus nigrescens]